MPANPKYLTQNRTQRFAKVTAALLGSLLVSASTMLAIAAWSKNPRVVFLTYSYFFFMQWCALMLVAFLFKNGWKCWLWYGSITAAAIGVYLSGIR